MRIFAVAVVLWLDADVICDMRLSFVRACVMLRNKNVKQQRHPSPEESEERVN